jgi:hypothetical protein
MGWRCQDLSGGHYPMLTAPSVVATALLELGSQRSAFNLEGAHDDAGER